MPALTFLDGTPGGGTEATPEEYIRFVIDANTRNTRNAFKINEHWRPQFINCPFCLIPFKVYARYETHFEDTAYILLKSNLSSVFSLAGKEANVDRKHLAHHSKRRQEFWGSISKKYLHPLEKIFRLDYIMFQYD